MRFNFVDMTPGVRDLMVEEIADAIGTATLYFSKRFNSAGRDRWPELLLQAARTADEHWLAYQLEATGAMREFEARAKPGGGYTQTHVPHTAAETLADLEFNRYYMCAVARKAAGAGLKVSVYRAKCQWTGSVTRLVDTNCYE